MRKSSRPGTTRRGGGEGVAGAPGGARAACPAAARDFLEDAKSLKAVHDEKAARQALAGAGNELRGVVHDTALYSYLLQPTPAKHDLEDVVARRLGVPLSGAGG